MGAMKMSFDEWFDIFVDCVEKLGYDGPIDRDTFFNDYDENVTPEIAAQDFVNEMES